MSTSDSARDAAADGGGSVEPSLEAGAVTVGVGTGGPSGAESNGSVGSNEPSATGSAGNGGSTGSTAASEGDDGPDDDSMPGFAIGAAVAALAVRAAVSNERAG